MSVAGSSVTNHQFGAAVDCNYTMASRLRNGRRMPSAALLIRIIEAYNLDPAEAMQMYKRGKIEDKTIFSNWLIEKVFQPKGDADAA